ncbi:5-oxoprolinase subunit PxpB [Ferrovibrio sp. MS7]|uniref:5-oxoprolinase subunit PxpB n=1 Tax=Ferrovibrio plantarum TaxID=3119164 RepID=UPI003136B990
MSNTENQAVVDQAPVVFQTMGDTAFSVEFATKVDRAANARVMALHRMLAAAALPGVIEAIPSFGALVIQYDPLSTSRAGLQQAVEAMLPQLKPEAAAGRLWSIPCCYDAEFAPDLAEVAERRGLKPADVVQGHSQGRYFIYMLGFMPGLAYMGGLSETLQLPRRSAPRLKVPQGSVAIAEAMTTIYPWESPGGWHLIGRTPVRLFEQHRPEPILFAAGDEVTFRAVSRAEFDKIAAEVAAGRFNHGSLKVMS